MILNHKIMGEGAPLIIVHGLFGSLDNWLTLGRRFAESRQVILVDQRNHGRSFHSEQMNYQWMAEDLVALMDYLNIETADIIGHSMGGKTVMKMALEFPERLDRMIVADIGPKQYPSHHESILNALYSVDLEEVKSRGQAMESMKEHIGNDGVLQFLAKNLYWIEKGQLAWRMNLDVLSNKMDEILDSIGLDTYDGATLFIRGGQSDYIPDEDLMAIQMQFVNSEIVAIESAGHWLHAEEPQVFFDLVDSFIS